MESCKVKSNNPDFLWGPVMDWEVHMSSPEGHRGYVEKLLESSYQNESQSITYLDTIFFKKSLQILKEEKSVRIQPKLWLKEQQKRPPLSRSLTSVLWEALGVRKWHFSKDWTQWYLSTPT